jgi:hypothetical protein
MSSRGPLVVILPASGGPVVGWIARCVVSGPPRWSGPARWGLASTEAVAVSHGVVSVSPAGAGAVSTTGAWCPLHRGGAVLRGAGVHDHRGGPGHPRCGVRPRRGGSGSHGVAAPAPPKRPRPPTRLVQRARRRTDDSLRQATAHVRQAGRCPLRRWRPWCSGGPVHRGRCGLVGGPSVPPWRRPRTHDPKALGPRPGGPGRGGPPLSGRPVLLPVTGPGFPFPTLRPERVRDL